MQSKKNSLGVTYLEAFLIVSIIVLLIGILVFAVRPKDKLSESRNEQRYSDVIEILEYVDQYFSRNGVLPSEIPSIPKEICKPEGDCRDYLNLSVLTDDQGNILPIPVDPEYVSSDGSGYAIHQSPVGEVHVSAVYAEQGASIEVSKLFSREKNPLFNKDEN